ncbi:PucR family transcriptional regulator [Microbacterium sp. XT11]|uniref:PucR family transcriptional regulator n=1 Tax=Microbacterium sp. XT11 TaxID=367477 RepID=UPI000831BF18|nr:helix-turn-helix domain-containing protein [Microbacterium sp. XT11]
MTQYALRDLVDDADRLGLRLTAGPVDDREVARVDISAVDRLDALGEGTLALIPGDEQPPPFRIDVALRQASARGLAGLVFTAPLTLAETARVLADRGRVPVFSAPGAGAAELATTIDRAISGGASEAMMRGARAVTLATEAAAAPDSTPDSILATAGAALGIALEIVQDPTAAWNDPHAVFIGEVAIGRVTAERTDGATDVALPVIAALVSRVAQRRSRDRYAPVQSRSDLLVELVLADASRAEGFVAQAARLGLPLPQSHVVAWLTPTGRSDPDALAPRSVQPALELFALQLVEGRDEMWHVAFLQDDLMLVCTEEHGAGDHQRRVREVATQVQHRAQEIAGSDWAYTLGLGTPQVGALGLRQSAAEARVAAESAIAAGRLGGVELTDVTGLRRVLLDLYASPISRELLDDILRPLDRLGPERALQSVRTLLAYLAHEGSLVHAGKELMLHPNGVGYRMRRIRELLGIDLDDRDARFAVELACRVRLLGAR